MSKHKKTRQQKIIAELRRKLSSKNQTEVSPLAETTTIKISQVSKVAPSTTCPYLLQDLLKTTFLTSFIVVLQLILFFLSKSRIIVFPMLQ